MSIRIPITPHRILLALEGRVWFVVGGVSLWVALEIGYRLFVQPLYDYSGFSLEFNLVKYLEAWGLYGALLLLSPRQLLRPSDYFMTFLLFGLLSPLLIFYSLANQPREHLYIVILGVLIIDIARRGKKIRIPTIKGGRSLTISLLVAGAGIVSVWFIISGGVGSLNFDLTKVYEFRREVGSSINVGLMSYVNIWAYKVFGPGLLAIALWKKHYLLAVCVVALHVFWFGVSSNKSVLFYPFLVFFLWFWFGRTRALSIVPLAMTGIVAAALMLYFLTDHLLFASMFIRRVFFVIADNTFYYYDFFSQNEFVFWSNSITASIIDYPYHINYAELIGESRGTESHVNNTFLATGYMHAGIPGIVFYSVVAGMLFRVIDGVAAAGIPVWVAVAVLIVPSRSLLLSADLPTALLTHGIGIGIIVLLLLRKRDESSGKSPLLCVK